MDAEQVFGQLAEIMGIVSRARYVTQDIIGVMAAVIAICFLINCFFGYKLIRLQIAIAGLLIGGVVGALASGLLVVASDLYALEALIPICTVICAIVGVKLAFTFYKLGIFLYAASIPAVIGVLIGAAMQEEGVAVAGVIVACLIGILAVFLSRPYLIAITAIPSGLAAGPLVLLTFGSSNIGGGILIGVVLAVAGVLVQWKTTGAKEADGTTKAHVSDPEKIKKNIAVALYIFVPLNAVLTVFAVLLSSGIRAIPYCILPVASAVLFVIYIRNIPIPNVRIERRYIAYGIYALLVLQLINSYTIIPLALFVIYRQQEKKAAMKGAPSNAERQPQEQAAQQPYSAPAPQEQTAEPSHDAPAPQEQAVDLSRSAAHIREKTTEQFQTLVGERAEREVGQEAPSDARGQGQAEDSPSSAPRPKEKLVPEDLLKTLTEALQKLTKWFKALDNNYITGIIGAIVFGFIVCWILMDWVGNTGLVRFPTLCINMIVPIICYFGYKLLKGKMDNAAIIVPGLITVIWTLTIRDSLGSFFTDAIGLERKLGLILAEAAGVYLTWLIQKSTKKTGGHIKQKEEIPALHSEDPDEADKN